VRWTGPAGVRFTPRCPPSVTRSLIGDLNSYLSSVGEQAAVMQSDMVAKYRHSPEFKKMPHLEQVRALQSRLPEVQEVIRHDIINQPFWED
jgi:hypothetical protein